MIIEYLFDTLKAWKQSAADAVGSQFPRAGQSRLGRHRAGGGGVLHVCAGIGTERHREAPVPVSGAVPVFLIAG